MSSPTNPAWLNHGDNAWQLTAASLVGLQSIPGLVVLYAGIVKAKWAINSAFMAFYAFAAVLICWVVYAYKMAFGPQWGSFPLLGAPGPVIAMDYELRQAVIPAANVTAAYPLSTMVYFQFVFAAITVVIMAGAFLGRMNFTAWMIFVPLWITFSYVVGAFSLWGGGFLFQRGVIDYSGGYVIHLSSGTAGWVGAAVIGPRLARDREDTKPNNILFVLVGAGILWIGWNGFNGGDPYTASPDAGAAVLNTNVATAMSSLVWTILDIIFYKKPSVIGAVQGMITGLVAITPAAGVVAGWGAIIIGACSGSVPWITLNIGKKNIAALRVVDDSLDVLHTHAVAGFLGGFLVGIFATAEGCAAFAALSPGGAIAGNGKQVWLQIVGALFIIGLNLFMTPLILFFIKYVLRVPLRMSEEDLLIGDDAIHGEAAYGFVLSGENPSMMSFGNEPRRYISGDPEIGPIAGRSPPESTADNEVDKSKDQGKND
jgi:Amt family ammonium transporter